MDRLALLQASARCHAAVGHWRRAAERWWEAGHWWSAGRCFERAGLDGRAEEAWVRAGELLQAARACRRLGRASRARRRYREALSALLAPEEEVEALLATGPSAWAWAVASSPERAAADRLRALSALAEHAVRRGRPDLACQAWSAGLGLGGDEAKLRPAWRAGLPWNRTLPRAVVGPEEVEAAWPQERFDDVELREVRAEEVGAWWHGNAALACSDDGEAFAAAADTTGVALGRFGTPGVRQVATPPCCNCVAFLPGRRSVLAGLDDGRVVRVEPGGSVVEVEALRMPGGVWSLSFSPGGDRVAVGCYARPGALLRVWEWRGTEPEAPVVEDRVPERGDRPPCAFSLDGRSLAWSPAPSMEPNDLVLLDSGRRRVVSAAHGDLLRSLTYTPDGRYLLTASYDNTVVLRDAAAGEPLAPPLRFGGRASSVVVHPAAALVAVGSDDGAVPLYRLGPGPRLDPVGEQRFCRRVYSVAFSPDGRYLLALAEKPLTLDARLHLFTLHLTGGR